MLKLYPVLLTIFVMTRIYAQDAAPLYDNKIPNSKPAPNKEKSEKGDGWTMVTAISIPTIQYYPAPDNVATQTAVIVFPGGGYHKNAIQHEGHDIARKLNEIGVTAFVVKYRIPDDNTMVNKEIGPLQDAQQAIKHVRENASKYKINPDRIGIIGFSAGGHLASTAGTHFKKSQIPNEKNTNLRPDFMILVYPVISFQKDIAHMGSRENLIGKNPSPEKIAHYSNELQIRSDTPPTFLIHASDDDVVVPANSIRFYENLLKHLVKAELHLYQSGGHGFGLKNPTTSDDWFERCKNWMVSNKLLEL
jgi:acetyl esterase/lipase